MKDEFPAPLSQNGPQPLWDPARDYIRVVLRDMQVEARVGMHPWEMHPERPHRLIVNVELFAYATEAFFELPHELSEDHPELFDCLLSFYIADPRKWFSETENQR